MLEVRLPFEAAANKGMETMANDQNPFMDMFSRFGESLHMPKMDIDAVLANHRKNIEALEQSARAAAAGAMSLMNRQREAIAEGMREATAMAQSVRTDPQEMAGKQAEWTRRSFEAAVNNAGEMAEIIRKSGTESVDILRQRVRESMEDAMKAYSARK